MPVAFGAGGAVIVLFKEGREGGGGSRDGDGSRLCPIPVRIWCWVIDIGRFFILR